MNWSRTLNTAANVPILAAVGYILVRPGGIAGDLLASRREREQERRLVAGSWDRLLAEASSVSTSGGAVRAVFVEFGDYQCRYCVEQHRLLQRLLAEHPDAELWHVHSPLPIHRHAEPAARAAICAEEQEKFREMHNRLYDTSPEWGEVVDWAVHAKAAGVPDLEAFRSCLNSEQTSARLDRAKDLARELGITATPSLVHRRGVHRGLLTDSAFVALLDPA